MNIPIAHAGHWLVNVLYIMPLVIVLGVLAYQGMRDRKHGKPERAEIPKP